MSPLPRCSPYRPIKRKGKQVHRPNVSEHLEVQWREQGKERGRNTCQVTPPCMLDPLNPLWLLSGRFVKGFPMSPRGSGGPRSEYNGRRPPMTSGSPLILMALPTPIIDSERISLTMTSRLPTYNPHSMSYSSRNCRCMGSTAVVNARCAFCIAPPQRKWTKATRGQPVGERRLEDAATLISWRFRCLANAEESASGNVPKMVSP
jgi:hypothetical protein